MVGDVLDDEGNALARELTSDQCGYRHHDVTDAEQWSGIVTEAIDRFGQLDILVNNAGIFRILPMMQTSLEDYRRINDVNQIGVFLGMQAVAPHLIDRGGGSIINISSIAGLRGSQASFAYSASKWAVRGMTKCAALELGAVQGAGELDPPRHHRHADAPGVRDTSACSTPCASASRIGDVASPEDVARLALFLASDDSTYCTGSEFIVDGGMTTGL